MMRLAASMTVCLVLAACGSAPRREAPSIPERSRPPPPPADLASIPDAVPRDEPRSMRGNPASYEVFDERELPILVDGRLIGAATHFELRCTPDALVVVV